MVCSIAMLNYQRVSLTNAMTHGVSKIGNGFVDAQKPVLLTGEDSKDGLEGRLGIFQPF